MKVMLNVSGDGSLRRRGADLACARRFVREYRPCVNALRLSTLF